MFRSLPILFGQNLSKTYVPEMYINIGKKNPSSNQEQRMQKEQFKFASTALKLKDVLISTVL